MQCVRKNSHRQGEGAEANFFKKTQNGHDSLDRGLCLVNAVYCNKSKSIHYDPLNGCGRRLKEFQTPR